MLLFNTACIIHYALFLIIMNFFDAIILGIVQGLTEFIPVSSSAHLIIVRDFLGIRPEGGLAFDAILQLATILAVAVYFYKDIYTLCRSLLLWVLKKEVTSEHKTLIVSIAFGTVPAVVLGLLLESYMDTVFRTVILTSVTLILGSCIFFLAEKYARYNQTLSPKKGFIIGFFQALALIPGMSRSGMTISGGLFLGLSREMATRFSFLLSLPIITGSGLKKVYDLFSQGEMGGVGGQVLVASFFAFCVGLMAIHFLITYLKKHSLSIFAWYRIVLALALIAFSFWK